MGKRRNDYDAELVSNEIGHPRNSKLSRCEAALLALAGGAIAFAIYGLIATAGR